MVAFEADSHWQANYITEDGARDLAEALCQHGSITALHLRHNRLGVEGIRILLDMLLMNDMLESLHLGNNNTSEQQAAKQVNVRL